VQYLYLLIFIFFIMLNVVIGLASSRSKKRRAAAQKPSGESAISNAPDENLKQLQRTEPRESILRPQTAESITESLFEVEEERASVPGGHVQAPRDGALTPSVPETGETQEEVRESKLDAAVEVEESKPMIDISRPGGEVKLSLEKNLLESAVEARAVKMRREQDEKYQVYDLYDYHDVEKGAWDNINKLPPLKRAIIFSEILGAPKALSEGRHSE